MRLYIDPGTGSMLFTILIGLFGTGLYFFRGAKVRLRFLFGGGKKVAGNDEARVPFAIFTDSKRYWNLFEPICEQFEKRGLPMLYLTASPDDPALDRRFEHVTARFVGEGNRAFAQMNFLKADVVLSSTPGLDVYQWKRSKDVKWYVHIAHGANDPAMYRMFGLDFYDAVTVSGDYQIQQLREIERKHNAPAKELPMLGLPHMDALLRRAESAEPLAHRETTVLLAPSWGPNGIFRRFGAKILEELLRTGYHIIVRPHPQTLATEKELIEPIMARFPEGGQLEWNRDNDNFEVLRRADVLISDFSGIIFDYALVFQRGVIYTDVSYDKGPFDAWWLDEELWTFETLPKIGKCLTPENLPELKNMIDELLHDPSYQAAIEKARTETWSCIGRSAELIADYAIQKQKELTAAPEADA
ncbi:MAG: CDP-glycerol glycerophosphotransferase family protein [Oscillospiraceae bacterium]|nr:CDP-glycerol glycerophosphotransferase family protein [Oscillospiraceae bacterium]